MAGRKFSHPFPPECRPQDLYKVVADKVYPNFTPDVGLGCDNRAVFPFKLLFQGKTIPYNDSTVEDKNRFEEMKKQMKAGTLILVGEKLSGGDDNELSGMNAISAKFLIRMKSALDKLPTWMEVKCLMCRKTTDCIQFTCSTRGCLNDICTPCIPEHFARNGYLLPCFFCEKIIELDTFIPGDAFKMSYNHFEHLDELQRTIDFQKCK
ncbi:unnamed protein product [Adineta steineri]|uniref:Uncharacterized protein n=1 Tax=Adineta steineri TaxID=433720 RepID=A0A815GSD0_9BILA|nr:unnamed protein product [Adineta steineri]